MTWHSKTAPLLRQKETADRTIAVFVRKNVSVTQVYQQRCGLHKRVLYANHRRPAGHLKVCTTNQAHWISMLWNAIALCTGLTHKRICVTPACINLAMYRTLPLWCSTLRKWKAARACINHTVLASSPRSEIVHTIGNKVATFSRHIVHNQHTYYVRYMQGSTVASSEMYKVRFVPLQSFADVFPKQSILISSNSLLWRKESDQTRHISIRNSLATSHVAGQMFSYQMFSWMMMMTNVIMCRHY